MARATLALLGACCLAAALLGGQASEPVELGAQFASDSHADSTSKSAWVSCASQQESKAFVSGVQAALNADGSFSISMSVEPGEVDWVGREGCAVCGAACVRPNCKQAAAPAAGMDVQGGEVIVNLTYHGQLAGHQRFDLCISMPKCPLRSGTYTLLGLGGRLPERPVVRHCAMASCGNWHSKLYSQRCTC